MELSGRKLQTCLSVFVCNGGCVGVLMNINFKKAIMEYKVTIEFHFIICAVIKGKVNRT